MTELKIPNDLVVEAAGLLERRPPELEAEDIVDALRRLHDGRSEEPTPDDPTEEHTRRLRELEERYGRVHEAIEGRLARSPAGKRLLAERARLGDKLQEIAERVRGEEISDAQGSSEVVDLVERLQLAHRREVLQVATESADQHPSLEVLLQVLHPDEDLLAQRVVWDAQVAPFQAIVLKPTAGDDLADVRQGLGEPTPPTQVGVCKLPAYARDFGRSWQTAIGLPSVLAVRTVGFASVYTVAYTAGGSAARALVGGDDVPVPAGPTRYQAEVRLKYTYNANSWAFLAISGGGAEFQIEIDKDDGDPPEFTAIPLFSMISAVCSGAGVQDGGTRTIRVPFTRATSAEGKVNVMAGVSSHVEAGGGLSWAEISMLATVEEICVKSV